MGKEPKNGFCHISVNKILKITSQYNTSLGSFPNYFFRHFPCFAVAPTPFCIAVCSKFRQLPS